MSPKTITSLSPKDLWGLLDHEEQNALAKEEDLFPAAASEEFTPASLESIPITDLLRRVIRLRLPFIIMMREFCDLLDRLEATTPGNIRLVILPDAAGELSVDFGSQIRAAVAVGLNTERLISFHEDIEERLAALKRDVARLSSAVRPRNVARYTGQGRLWNELANRGFGTKSLRYRFLADNSKRHTMEYHPFDAQKLRELDSCFSDFSALVRRISSETCAAETPALVAEIDRLAETIHLKALEARGKLSSDYPLPPRSGDDSDYARCEGTLRSLKEAVLASSDFAKSFGDLIDFMDLELWRHRWRIYELWLLARVEMALERIGATIADKARVRDGEWKLKYTKDSEPVLSLRLAGVHLKLFYQLFEEGVSSNDMPDIAVRVQDRYALVIDPKHGETYIRRDMQKVCMRYSEHFTPELSMVVNYFKRTPDVEELSGKNRRLILYGLQPRSDMERRFDSEVELAVRSCWKRHNLPDLSPSVIVLFDISGSTSNLRERFQMRLLGELQSLCPPPTADSRILLFGEAVVRELEVDKVATGGEELRQSASGTNIPNAVRAGIDRVSALPSPRQLWLFTDGQSNLNFDLAVAENMVSAAIHFAVFDFSLMGGETELVALCERVRGKYEHIVSTLQCEPRSDL